MAPAVKALGFFNEANDWFFNVGLPSDLTIIIDGVNFHLHKFPIVSRCGKIEKMIKETQNNDTITLDDIPGGTNTFLVAFKFCYGVRVELTPRNIVMVYRVADYLEMKDEYGDKDDNLFSKAESYFHKNVLKNWKDCIVALESCETILTRTDNLEIINKCLNATSSMVSTDPGLFARIQTSESDWWFDDVSHLHVVLFERLIKTMQSEGIQPEKLTGAIMYYSGKCLHGLNRWKGRSNSRFTTKLDLNGQRVVLEKIVEILPQTKGKSICRFLLGLLRVGLILGVSEKCSDSLERRIGMQLEFATLDGLMIPNYSDSDTLYNIESVERMISYFIEETGSDLKESPLRNVSKIVDSYIAEIASDVNLKPEKIHSLVKSLPESSRTLNDGLYRALDIYFEAHPWLPEKEKERLCNIMDLQKLSIDACAHVSQNKRLPLRVILEVLFFEQMNMKTALGDCLAGMGVCSDMALVRENEKLRDGMEKMRIRVRELEEEFKNLREEMKKMSFQTHGSPRFLSKTFAACKLLPRVSDAQRDVESNGFDTPRRSKGFCEG